MSLTKTTAIDQITVCESGIVLYREATRIMEDDNQISQTYHRSSLTPGASLDNVPPQVALIAQATWTPENIAPVTQAVTEAIAVQQAAIDEAAAKKAADDAEAERVRLEQENMALENEAEAAKSTAERTKDAAVKLATQTKKNASTAEHFNQRYF